MSNAHAYVPLDPLSPPDRYLEFEPELAASGLEIGDGPRAMEIQTLYRQVLIGTRHLYGPRRGRGRGRGFGRRGRAKSCFVIGAAAGADAPVSLDYLPSASHDLVAPSGMGYVINVTRPMSGEVSLSGQRIPLQEMVRQRGASFALPPDARARLECGEMTFLVNGTSRPRALGAPLFAWRWEQERYTAGAAIGLGLFLLMIFALPPDPRSLSLDLLDTGRHFAKLLLKPPAEEPAYRLQSKGAAAPAGASRAAKDAEGEMGKPTSRNRPAHYAIRGPKENLDPHISKQLAADEAKNAGVLGVFKRMDGSPVSAIFAADSALGNEAENVLGHLVGDQIGEAYGVGGLGPLGTGRGGGGEGQRAIGIARFETGGGVTGGRGYGRGAGLLGGHHTRVPDVIASSAQVRGSLDREIVRRIIRRHVNEVKFCYEQEMLKKPDLSGRIMVQFTIAASGQVISSVLQGSTMGNARVENCTVQAVRRWEFPKPNGGGLVMVSYPFVLTPAGAGG